MTRLIAINSLQDAVQALAECEPCHNGDHLRCRAEEDSCQDGVNCPDYLSEGCFCQELNHENKLHEVLRNKC